MAGYVINGPGKHVEFHIGAPDLAKKIMDASESKKVVLLQLDCDELDAALWGLSGLPKQKLYCTTKNTGPSMGTDPKYMLYLGTSLDSAIEAVGTFVQYEQSETKFPAAPQYPFLYTALPRSMEGAWHFVKYYAADGWWYSIVSFEVG